MITYTAEFILPNDRHPVSATYYGDALTPDLLKSITADLHRHFDLPTPTGKPKPIKILRIYPEPTNH